MQNFLYVFTPQLAEQLEKEGFDVKKHERRGKEYWMFVVDKEKSPQLLFNFTAGADFIYSNKLFF